MSKTQGNPRLERVKKLQNKYITIYFKIYTITIDETLMTTRNCLDVCPQNKLFIILNKWIWLNKLCTVVSEVSSFSCSSVLILYLNSLVTQPILREGSVHHPCMRCIYPWMRSVLQDKELSRIFLISSFELCNWF